MVTPLQAPNETDPWVLVFDGDCGFCRYCVDYARAVTNVEANRGVRYEPYQQVAAQYPDISVEEFKASIRLFTPASRYHGAQAAFRVLALAPRLRGWLWCYRFVPLFALIAEAMYRFTARHRGAVYRLARPLFGAQLLPADYHRTSGIVIRGIGLAALFAFTSWWWQAAGLIGSQGILPVRDYFDAAHAQLGSSGWLLLPSLYWLSSADWMTTALCAAGSGASIALMLRVWPFTAALVAYVCYLSLLYGGSVFLEYQWDVLLVESLVVAAVLGRQPRIGIWLTRLLVFRFMFLSGAVKLASGDPTWRDLSALDVHFESQPLPTVAAWYADHLPRAVLHFGTAATFFIELGLPFLIFAPRNLRRFAAGGFLLLELLIVLTGNYNFFNLLTIVLCLGLLDDRTFGAASGGSRRSPTAAWRAVLPAMAVLGALQIHLTLARAGVSAWETSVLRIVQPLQLVNNYGLFAVMTTHRDELVVEGSADGTQWQELPFKFKPQRLDEAPRWATPHQPRLDWQMWFAALTSREGAPWFDNFVVRLLSGAPEVYALLDTSAFAAKPPQLIRVLRYRYQFTTPEQRAQTGAWWRRQYVGVWYPPARLAGSGADATSP
jgi:predicted DCC family thiol-disulfide oxidoreductase YuxK